MNNKEKSSINLSESHIQILSSTLTANAFRYCFKNSISDFSNSNVSEGDLRNVSDCVKLYRELSKKYYS